MSSSEDDMPLSRMKRAPDAKERRDASSDDDVPISRLAKKHTGKTGSKHSRSAVASKDSDDDLSLTDLKKKVEKMPKIASRTERKAKPVKSKAAQKLVTKKVSQSTSANKVAKKTSKPMAKAAGKSKSTRKARPREQDAASGDKLVTRSEILYETKKGKIIQKLLCRWWYAMDWPTKDDIIPAPPLYEALEGYPGVYVCVEGDDIGKLVDKRDRDTCPCFTNFANKRSEELKGLLEEALSNQKKALVEHWGQGVEEEDNITRELKWLKGIDPGKADREADRTLAQAQDRINN